MYCFVLYLLDNCQIDGNANFKNEFHNWTKIYFIIIKVIEQQVPPLLWRHYYVYVQHSTVINSPIFQVIIAVRPITLVMGKISYEDKARIETLRKLGFGYQTIVAKFPDKGWRLCSVKAICKRDQWAWVSNGTKARLWSAENSTNRGKCWLAKIELWLWCCATSPNIKLIE